MKKRWRTPARVAMLALVAAFAVFSQSAPASAQTRVCRDLESRLASLPGGARSPRQAMQYDKAIRTQREQIAKAQDQRRRAGCGGGLFSRQNAGQACQSLTSTLDRMHANLASLERKHRQLEGGGRAERGRLLAAIDANGCRERPNTARSHPKDPGSSRNLFEQLFGGPVREERPVSQGRRFPLEDEARRRIIVRRSNLIEIQPQVSGTFRTLCVRTCDGYFFPVSYSTYADDLDRDEAACSAMCPGTDVELYMHRAPEEEADRMVSMSGIPYTELPTAFRYRQAGYQRPPGCSCGASRGFSIVAGQPSSQPEPAAMPEPFIPMPRPRPDPAEDPETIANREGGLDVAAIRRLLGSGDAAPDTTASVTEPTKLPPPGERAVRVVGPTFLPDPEGAIDLRAPVQTQLR